MAEGVSMDWGSLYDEVKNDQAERGYGAMATAADIAASINAADIPDRQLVPLWKIKRHAIENGYWLKIVDAAANHATSSVKAAAQIVLEYMADQRFENLDLDLQATKDMLAALVSGLVLGTTAEAAQAIADAIDAMGDCMTSRRAILGLPEVYEGDVARVRAEGYQPEGV